MAESIDAATHPAARAGVGLTDAAVLAGCTLAIILPVLLWGPVDGHDVGVHLHWIGNFRQSLAEGCWYPRWLRGVNNGFGSPTFNFYFPAFSYATVLARLVLPDLITSMWTVSALALWSSGVAMLFFLCRYCDRAAALLGAIVYMAAPYRLLDLYERGAFPESMAFVWPPLIVAAMDRHSASGSRRWLGVIALASGGLTFTHHGMIAIFMPLLAAYACLARSMRAALLQTSGLVLGLAIGAVSLLPAIAERSNVQWMPPVYRWNFAYSTAPVLFPQFAARIDIDVAFYGIASLFAALTAWSLRSRPVVLLSAACILSFFLACSPSEWVWDAVSPLQMIDLPWRWLSLSTFAVAALVGFAVADGPVLRLVAVACAVLGVGMAVNDWIIPAHYAPELHAETGIDASWPDRPAVRPLWAPETNPEARGPLFGGGYASLVRDDCAIQVLQVSGNREATLELDTFYYPSWIALVDGEVSPITPSRSSGRITLRIPKGSHEVRLEFRDTPLQQWSARLSLIAFVVAAGLCLPRVGGRR